MEGCRQGRSTAWSWAGGGVGRGVQRWISEVEGQDWHRGREGSQGCVPAAPTGSEGLGEALTLHIPPELAGQQREAPGCVDQTLPAPPGSAFPPQNLARGLVGFLPGVPFCWSLGDLRDLRQPLSSLDGLQVTYLTLRWLLWERPEPLHRGTKPAGPPPPGPPPPSGTLRVVLGRPLVADRPDRRGHR